MLSRDLLLTWPVQHNVSALVLMNYSKSASVFLTLEKENFCSTMWYNYISRFLQAVVISVIGNRSQPHPGLEFHLKRTCTLNPPK